MAIIDEEVAAAGSDTSYASQAQPVGETVGQETEPDSESDLWGNLDESFDQDFGDDATLDRTAPPPAAEEPQAPVEPVVTPVAEQVAPAPVEQQVAPTQAEPQQPVVQEQQPVFAPPPAVDPAQLEQVRQQYVSQLAQTYAMDEQTAEMVDTNFSAVAPQLMSQMHMRIAESVTQTLGQMLPQLITMQVQQMQTVQKNVGEFYGQWPELSRPEYQNTLGQIAQMYRQLKPQASQAEFIRDVGIQAWTALGLPLEQLMAKASPQQQAQPVAQPMQQQQFPQGGYAPATPGAPARSQMPPSAQSNNPFSQFAEEFLSDYDD